jgi:hypothetical protein
MWDGDVLLNSLRRCLSPSGMAALGVAVVTVWPMADVQARPVAAREWGVNAWGVEPPRVVQGMREERCRSGGADGVVFQITDKRRGEAEMALSNALKPMVAYEFTARIKALTSGTTTVPVDLFFRKDGPHYQTAVIRTVKAGADWQSVSLKGVYFLDGEGSVRVSVPAGAAPVCVSQAAIREIAADEVGAPPRAYRITSRLFGVHLNKLGSHNSWPAFDPGVVRLWDSGTTWADMQPDDEPIDWAHNPAAVRMQYYLKHVRRHGGSDSELMMTLGMTPRWAATPGTCNPAPYGPTSCRPPQLRSDWRRFVAELARRFDGQIRLWEVWNEADMWFHWGGDAQGLVNLLKDARDELKAVNPENVVIGPNVTVNGLRLLNDFLNRGAGNYMDGLSFHAYFGRTPSIALAAVRNVRQMLSYHGLDLPLWNTEVGIACDTPATCARVGAPGFAREGLAAIAQGLIGEAALGVVNTNYHTWEGGVVASGHLPLVEDDFRTETDAGVFYRKLRTLLVGKTVRWVSELPGHGGLVEVQGLQKSSCLIAWGEDGVASANQLMGIRSWKPLDGSRAETLEPQASLALQPMPVLGCPR